MLSRFAPPQRAYVHPRNGWAVFLFCGLLAGGAQAACPSPESGIQPRNILALYNGEEEGAARDTRIHRYLELPLNHLGYLLRYHDLSRDLPPEPDAEVAAILSWFEGEISQEGYAEWVGSRAEECGDSRARILIGHPGLTKRGADDALFSDLESSGVQTNGAAIRLGDRSEIILKDDLLEMEADFVVQRGVYDWISAHEDATPLLRLRPHGAAETTVVDLAVIGPRGGYLHDSATLEVDPTSGSTFWVVDPFRFLQAILDKGIHPIPDVTTRAGRRLYFSTVRSEGWLAQEPGRQLGQQPPLAAELLRDELIAPYPDLPVTLGVLSGDFDPSLAGVNAETGLEVARSLFSLPQVQPASTGASLILDWEFFADYDPNSEAERLDLYAQASSTGRKGLLNAAVETLGHAFVPSGQSVFDRVPGAPRKYIRDPFDLTREIKAPLDQVASMGVADGTRAMHLWVTGSRPFREAIETARESGARSIGGGGGIWVDPTPSLSGLFPFTAPVDGDLQIYDALSGDDIYTDYRANQAIEFYKLAQTLRNSDQPRRLKPFHLSYTAQSATDFGARSAIRHFLDMARSEAVIPVTADLYASIVDGFVTAKIVEIDAQRWRIEDRGDLNTMRFDGAADLHLDLDSSLGILGARRLGEALYIALDPAHPAPVLSLAPGGGAAAQPRDRPSLLESRLDVRELTQEGCVTAFRVDGFAAGDMVWSLQPDTLVEATLTQPDGQIAALPQMVSDQEGRVSLSIPHLPAHLRLSTGC
jgi:polysaccharide biosynthesis protein PelA